MFAQSTHFSLATNLEQVLQQDEVFRGFSVEAKQCLLRHAKYRRFWAEQLILRQQQQVNDLYVLLEGTLQVGWLQENGQLKMADYMSHSSAFNLVPFFQQLPMDYDFIALDRVAIAVIDGPVFLQLLQHEPQAMWRMISLLSQRMSRLFSEQRYLHNASLEQRLAWHLVKFCEQYGVPHLHGIRLRLKISQQDFAELLNVSRQTLNKIVKRFRQQYMLEWRYHQVVIWDLEQLKRLSQF